LAAAPASAADVPLDLLPGESSHLPPVTLLADGVPLPATGVTSEAAGAQGRLLIAALADFGVAAMMTAVRTGPITTSYELEPAPGVKTARVIGLADEIGLALGVSCIRIASLPGTARPMIIVELPNRDRTTLTLRGLLSDPGFERTAARLTIALGRDGPGAPVFADLGRLPHLLIAGARSSGRTTLLHSLLLSVLYRLPSEECRLLLINPGQPSAEGASLSDYANIPHLLTPVVTDPEEGLRALRWTVREMEQRYRSMAKIGVRNVESYNQRVDELASESARRMRTVQIGFNPVDGTPLYEEMQMDLSPLPLILVVIDDLGPLMRIGAMETEAAIQRLSQMARAVGIHMLVTCGAAGTDGLTASVKSQFASRICLRTLSRPDSRAVIGESGAEQLLGPGDALYMSPGGRVTRLHPALVGKEELSAIVRFLRSQGAPRYVSGVVSLEAALNSTKTEPMVAA
jgi:S-DNA-T family DNA segregation ATPase FtsK/SpoIIIE